MNENSCPRADELRALRNRAAVIAVGCAGKGQGVGDRLNRWGVQFGDIDRPSKGLACFCKEQLDNRVGAAERLETAKP